MRQRHWFLTPYPNRVEREMNRTVAIIGRLDLDNFGDVLLGRIFVEWLKNCQLRVICPGASEEVAREIQLDAIGCYSDADAILYIGGGYFGEPSGKLKSRMKWGHRLLKTIIFPGIRALFARKPIAILAPGYGPITNPIARIGTLFLFSRSRIKALRDLESIQFLKSYGYTGYVAETTDSALCMAGIPLTESAETSRNLWKVRAGGKKIILFHMPQKAVKIQGATYIIDHIKRLMADKQYLFVAITDQKETQGSRNTVSFYENTFGASERCVIHGYESPDELIGLIECASLTITTKLHVGMLSLARRTPVLSFSYHDKTLRFYRQAGFEGACLSYNAWTKENIGRQFEKIYNLVDSEVQVDQKLIDKALENKKMVEQFSAIIKGC